MSVYSEAGSFKKSFLQHTSIFEMKLSTKFEEGPSGSKQGHYSSGYLNHNMNLSVTSCLALPWSLNFSSDHKNDL